LAVDRNAFSAGGQYSCSMASRDQFMCTITQSGYQAIIAAAALRFGAMACCLKRHSIARPAHRPRSNLSGKLANSRAFQVSHTPSACKQPAQPTFAGPRAALHLAVPSIDQQLDPLLARELKSDGLRRLRRRVVPKLAAVLLPHDPIVMTERSHLNGLACI